MFPWSYFFVIWKGGKENLRNKANVFRLLKCNLSFCKGLLQEQLDLIFVVTFSLLLKLFHLDLNVKWFSLSNLLLYSVSVHSKYHMLVISSKTANKKTSNKLSVWKVNKSVFVMIYSALPLNWKYEVFMLFYNYDIKNIIL